MKKVIFIIFSLTIPVLVSCKTPYIADSNLIYPKENAVIADAATAGFQKPISTLTPPEQAVQEKINPGLLTDPWKANWITHPDISPKAYGVFHARKSFDLANDPEQFIIHITADNRFRLFVNGRHLTEGPARGDLLHWRFETIDIAPFLKSGKNTIAVVFWNFGEHKALSQISNQTAFLMQGNNATEEVVNTDDTWKIVQNKSYQPIPFGPIAFHGYYVVGPGEKIDASQYLWGWQEPYYDDSNWNSPVMLGAGTPQGNNSHQKWLLVQDQLPLMENIPQRFKSIRRSSGVSVADDFVAGKYPVQIPANSRATILFDNGENTTAFPELSINGGKNAVIRLTYGEALFDDNYNKGNRNEIEGKKIFGNYDEFTADGGMNRVFSTLYYRTFRYIQMDIHSGAEPLVLQDFKHRFTAYPFRENATFNSSDPVLKDIWNIGWRTARLCAYDTYMDTPYYEQLQYVGDTRIQALISLYVSGDDRLMRNAIEQIHNSMVPEGITQSRYPTELPQFIPNFSLYWISMLHDYWRYRSDDVFLKQYLPGVRNIISWFENRISDKDMVGLLPYWDFTDHSYKTKEIALAGKGEEGITPNTLHLAYSLRQAAELLDYFGETHDAERYRQLAEKLIMSTVEQTYDPERQLFADTPAKKSYSQHGNIFAVLTNAIPKEQQPSLLDKVTTMPDLVQQTIYFRFYLGQAFKQAGVADRYLENLDPWRTAVNLNFTTFPEGPEPTRSDCHAWSASPNYEFLATVCGIESASPGFKTVKIFPALGALEFIEGAMPHPFGEIKVKFSKQGKTGLMGEITLPPGLKGHFEYNDVIIPLKEGFQKVRV